MMNTKIGDQIRRLENNLLKFNPSALDNLLPGLSDWEIGLRTQALGIELEPELHAIYSWRNGSYTYSSSRRKYCNLASDFFPDFIFLNLDEALREGDKVDRGEYSEPNILPQSYLDNMICLFVSVDWCYEESYSKMHLPFSIETNLERPLPVFYRRSRYIDDHSEFQFDTLSNLFDHINYIYESGYFQTKSDENEGLPLSAEPNPHNYKMLMDNIYQNNPYCAEINQIVSHCPWPSRFFREGF